MIWRSEMRKGKSGGSVAGDRDAAVDGSAGVAVHNREKGSAMRYWLGFLLILSMAGTCWGQSATISYADGRPAETIAILERDDVYYVSVSDVARLLSLEKAVDMDLQQVTLKDGSHTLEILVGGTVWMKDGQTITAGEASMWEGREVFVGLASVDEILAPAFERSLRWEPSTKRILVGLPSPNITDLEVRSVRGRMSASIRTVGVPTYEFTPLSENQFEIFIKGGVLSRRLHHSSDGGLITEIESRQEISGAKVVVTLGGGRPTHRVFPSRNPDGIVMLVWERALEAIPEPELKPPRRLAWADRFSTERTEIDLVVIDPGHGGENFGSVGPSGYTEKEFNLEVARKLRRALERAGIDVILTRNDDVLVTLETRTEVANSVGADLFVSIHANGYRSGEASGFEVYFLSPPLDDESRTVAAMENASAGIISVDGLQPDDEVAFILWDTAQNEFVVESSHLAQLVDEELGIRLTIPNRGVKQANFVVLKGAYLPAILVETAFITNPREEALLRDEAFQETVAEGIVEAVMRFKSDYRR
jgi:N-acetylmuramoyl-L-alanine amidase